MKDTFALVVPR